MGCSKEVARSDKQDGKPEMNMAKNEVMIIKRAKHKDGGILEIGSWNMRGIGTEGALKIY